MKKALFIALAGFGGLVLLGVVIALFRGDSQESDPALLGVALFILGALAFGTMIAAGFLAARALRAKPMESGAGRLAVRMGIALAVFLPTMAIVLGLLAKTGTWESDSEPFLGIWVALALIASLIGVFAPEPGRRALLVFPLLIGVAGLVLFFSEVTGIT